MTVWAGVELEVTATRTYSGIGRCTELCGLYHSRMLFRVRIVTPAQFNGLDNYNRMIHDPIFWNALGVTLLYVVINITLQTKTFNFLTSNYNNANPAAAKYVNDWGVNNYGGIFTDFYPTAAGIWNPGGGLNIGGVNDPKGNELINASESVVAQLEGFRGAPALDREALREVILRFASLLRDHPQVTEVDLNPLRLMTHGYVVLEMRMRVERRRPPERVKTW